MSDHTERYEIVSAYIYVVWRAGRLSSVAGWAKLDLSPSLGLHHTNAASQPLERHQPNMSHPICSTGMAAIHIHLWASRDSGFCAFGFSPDANLIWRAVRIRAISVEVKCTVLSSAMGVFIFTKRWEEGKQRGQAHEPETTNEHTRKRSAFTTQTSIYMYASVFLVVSLKQIWSPNKLVLKVTLNMLSKWGKHKHLLVEVSSC